VPSHPYVALWFILTASLCLYYRESYSIEEQGWINRALKQRQDMGELVPGFEEGDEGQPISRFIHNYVGIDTSTGPWTVWHQYAPAISNRYFVNFNREAVGDFALEKQAIMKKQAVFSKAMTFVPGLDIQSTRDFSFMDQLLTSGKTGNYTAGEPVGFIYYPIFETVDEKTSDAVGVVMATVYWKSFFEGILSENMRGIVCVVENSKGQKFTYKVSGRNAEFLGMEDLHDQSFDKYKVTAEHSSFLDEGAVYHGVPVDSEYISYSINVYPSAELEDTYMTTSPILYGCCVFLVFLLAVVTFLMYDCYVEKRQRILYDTAVKTTAVVSSLFPENVTKRLMNEVDTGADDGKNKKGMFLSNKHDNSFDPKSKPIADLFPEA